MKSVTAICMSLLGLHFIDTSSGYPFSLDVSVGSAFFNVTCFDVYENIGENELPANVPLDLLSLLSDYIVLQNSLTEFQALSFYKIAAFGKVYETAFEYRLMLRNLYNILQQSGSVNHGSSDYITPRFDPSDADEEIFGDYSDPYRSTYFKSDHVSKFHFSLIFQRAAFIKLANKIPTRVESLVDPVAFAQNLARAMFVDYLEINEVSFKTFNISQDIRNVENKLLNLGMESYDIPISDNIFGTHLDLEEVTSRVNKTFTYTSFHRSGLRLNKDGETVCPSGDEDFTEINVILANLNANVTRNVFYLSSLISGNSFGFSSCEYNT